MQRSSAGRSAGLVPCHDHESARGGRGGHARTPAPASPRLPVTGALESVRAVAAYGSPGSAVALLGCIADDFTGATDLADSLALTPMTDSNLVRVLGRQTRRRVGLIPYATIVAGADAIRRTSTRRFSSILIQNGEH